VILAMF